MRVWTIPLTLLALASCSQGEQYAEESADYADQEMAASPAEAPSAERAAGPGGPDIAPTAAPGVAFNYRYAFRLPNEQIAEVQERHAQACEDLGINRCRIVGMRYRLQNERDIQAMLAFRLDPAIARAFGRDAGTVVAEADGMLVDAEITGTDEGANIARGDREGARTREDIARIEQRLAAAGLSEGERIQLNQQLETLRQALRAIQDQRNASEESLATTPMVFNYGSGNVIPGFDTRTPIRDSVSRAGQIFLETIGVFIVVLGILLPWAILAAILWIIVRLLQPSWLRRRRDHASETIAEEQETEPQSD